jgi:hypothetical protein
LGGDFELSNCIFKDYVGSGNDWYFIDNTNSSTNTNAKIDNFTFDSNHVSNVGGSLAMRGSGTGSSVMTKATITNNVMLYNTNIATQFWAAIEINSCDTIEIKRNRISGITRSISNGYDGPNGQVFQIWNKKAWAVDIQENDLSNNYQGIIIAASANFYVPTGEIKNNNLSNIDGVALSLQWPPEAKGSSQISSISDYDALASSEITPGSYSPVNSSQVLDAQNNYWGENGSYSKIYTGGSGTGLPSDSQGTNTIVNNSSKLTYKPVNIYYNVPTDYLFKETLNISGKINANSGLGVTGTATLSNDIVFGSGSTQWKITPHTDSGVTYLLLCYGVGTCDKDNNISKWTPA